MAKLVYPFGVLRVFFSLECNFNCEYCSMVCQPELWRGGEFAKEEVDPQKWIEAFERLEPTRKNFIVTPCNAEPPIYPGCAEIVNSGGLSRFRTHMYTNCSSLSMEEIREMQPRDNLAFYVSYHPSQISAEEFIENAKELQAKFNVINFHAPLYPPLKDRIMGDAQKMKAEGIALDTTHELLGLYDGEMNWSYLGGGGWIKKRLANRLDGTPKRKVLCKTSPNHTDFFSRTYTVAPNGDFYTCWRYLYNKDERGVIGNFFDSEFQFKDEYFECDEYGDCNFCAWHKDIKDAETGEQLDIDDTSLGGIETISACIITDNQEGMIEDCIASIVDWVDEIVLVDTGVTDNTLNIAKKVGGDKVKVFRRLWDDDFSAARNFSISKATQDWIFIIDTDERVVPGHGDAIKKMIPSIQQDIIVVDVANLYKDKDTGERVARSRLPSLRFFRSDYEIEYVRAVHNQPKVREGTVLNRVAFTINHLGYDLPPEEAAKKYERTVRMCRKLTETDPDNPESWLQLARVLRVRNGGFNAAQGDEIVKIIESGIGRCDGENDPQNIYIQLLSLMAWIKYAMREFNDSVKYGKRALSFKHDYLDAILVIGLSYSVGINALEGEKWIRRYLQEQEVYDFSSEMGSLVIEHANDRVLAYQVLIDIENAKQAQAAKVPVN